MDKKEFTDFLKGIDKSNINERMLMLPSQVFEHGYQVAIISGKLKRKEKELEEVIAKYSAQIRRRLSASGVKNFTENRVKDLVISQKEVAEIKKEIIDLTTKLKKAKVYLEALKTAREVLPNVSNNFREERRSTEKLTPRKRRM